MLLPKLWYIPVLSVKGGLVIDNSKRSSMSLPLSVCVDGLRDHYQF